MKISDYIDAMRAVAEGSEPVASHVYGACKYTMREFYMDSESKVQLFYDASGLAYGHIIKGDKMFQLDDDELLLAEETFRLYCREQHLRTHGIPYGCRGCE